MLKTPPLQTATATIDTLCSRLQSATLLEDRRAAILGLRSFAKQYPASVASGSLRELITTLRRDGLGEVTSTKSRDADGGGEEGGDVDTIRLVLETLLMLFNPDSSSPEASDEIAFFMADEFSMRQDNISLLLNLLDPTSPFADYYSRLYAVQLLSAVCGARPERLQECILGAPLGTSRVVGVLDDARDAVRNAGLLLLVDLTGGANEDLRKIVAFEDVFGKVFALIKLEGGLADAGIAGQDCLSLLANLVRGSASNQTMFRESGCVGQLTLLLREIFPSATPEARFIAESREKAGWGVLQLLRLFLTRGESSTIQNQNAFFRAGTAQLLLDIGFHPRLPSPVRVTAIKTAADLISNNPPLQEAFAPLQVAVKSASDPTPAPFQQTNGTRSSGPSTRNSARESDESARTYIIEALLELTLSQPRSDSSLRAAGCSLIQAYLGQHDRIKAHFLQRAIMGHKENEEAANVLTTLLQPGTDTQGILFASWIVQDLVSALPEAKTTLAAVKEGDESEGEDVLSAIQALGHQLEIALQTSAEERVIASYASTLTLLLWDFATGINDLLAEASSLIQVLVSTASSAATPPATAGLSAALLGTIYEFSTKDSPISRRTLAPILAQKLTRSKYLDALLVLRRDPTIRDFGLSDAPDEPEALNETFVDLFLTEYPRLRKAIDKDPGVEVLPNDAVEKGVDRDALDDLRQQLSSVKDALMLAQHEALESSQHAEQEKLALQKEAQTATAEVERLRRINQAMQNNHEEDSSKTFATHQRQKENLNIEHSRAMANARQEADRQARAARDQAEQAFGARAQDYERKLAELGNAHRAELSAHANARQNLERINAQHQEFVARERDAAGKLQSLTAAYQELEWKYEALQTSAQAHEAALAEARKNVEAQETELEGLRRQVKESQEEVKGREEELATERKGFGELEKELEAAKGAVEAAEGARKESEDARKETEKAEGEAKKTIAGLEKDLAATKSASEAANAARKQADGEAKAKTEKLQKELKDAKASADAAKKTGDGEVKKKIAALEKEVKDAKAATEAAKKQAEAAGKRAEGEAEKKIDKLEKDLKDAQTSAKTSAKKGDSDAKAKIEKLEKDLAEAQAAAEAADKKVEVNIEKLESDLASAEAAADAARQDFDREAAAWKDAENESAARIQELETELEAAQSAESKGEGEAAEKVKKLETLSKSLAGKVKDLQAALDAVKKAEREGKEEASRASEEARKELVQAKKAADTAAKDADGAKAAAREELDAMQLRAENAAKEADAAKEAVEQAKQDLESAKKELEAIREGAELAKNSAEEVRKGREEAVNSEREAREELENLLLVLGEIEGKRDEYKTKVRELGGEVTDEEDDSSEEEDEDEGVD